MTLSTNTISITGCHLTFQEFAEGSKLYVSDSLVTSAWWRTSIAAKQRNLEKRKECVTYKNAQCGEALLSLVLYAIFH